MTSRCDPRPEIAKAARTHQPYIDFPVIHLPDAYDDIVTSDPDIAGAGTIPSKELYRAAATHAAARLICIRQAISAEQLNPLQIFLVGLFEDARIEALAVRDLLGQSQTLPPVPVLKTIRIPYRDDNRIIWRFADVPWQDFERLVGAPKQIRRNVSLLKMINELDCELDEDHAQEVWSLETPFHLDQEGCTINKLEGKEPVSAPFQYPEWDYQAQTYRPNWVTVLEKRQPAGDPLLIDRIREEHRPIARRLNLNSSVDHGATLVPAEAGPSAADNCRVSGGVSRLRCSG